MATTDMATIQSSDRDMSVHDDPSLIPSHMDVDKNKEIREVRVGAEVEAGEDGSPLFTPACPSPKASAQDQVDAFIDLRLAPARAKMEDSWASVVDATKALATKIQTDYSLLLQKERTKTEKLVSELKEAHALARAEADAEGKLQVERIEKMSREMGELKLENQRLHGKVVQLKQDNEGLKKKFGLHVQEKEKLKEDVKQLDQQLYELKVGQKAKLQERIVQLKQESQRLGAEKQVLVQKVAELEELLSRQSFEAKSAQVEQRNVQLIQNTRLNEKNVALEQSKKKLEQRNVALVQLNRSLVEENQALKQMTTSEARHGAVQAERRASDEGRGGIAAEVEKRLEGMLKNIQISNSSLSVDTSSSGHRASSPSALSNAKNLSANQDASGAPMVPPPSGLSDSDADERGETERRIVDRELTQIRHSDDEDEFDAPPKADRAHRPNTSLEGEEQQVTGRHGGKKRSRYEYEGSDRDEASRTISKVKLESDTNVGVNAWIESLRGSRAPASKVYEAAEKIQGKVKLEETDSNKSSEPDEPMDESRDVEEQQTSQEDAMKKLMPEPSREITVAQSRRSESPSIPGLSPPPSWLQLQEELPPKATLMPLPSRLTSRFIQSSQVPFSVPPPRDVRGPFRAATFWNPAVNPTSRKRQAAELPREFALPSVPPPATNQMQRYQGFDSSSYGRGQEAGSARSANMWRS